jgi:hypothetical protein
MFPEFPLFLLGFQSHRARVTARAFAVSDSFAPSSEHRLQREPLTHVRVGDLLDLLLEDYDVRGRAHTYIASLKVKSILKPALGDIKASKLTTAQVQQYIQRAEKGS